MKVSRLFAFEEVDFPMLEAEELYVRKAGEEITQQVCNQIFLVRILVHCEVELTPR